MRYITQPNDYTCAPVAIINLSKWAGKRATRKHVRETSRWCKTTKEYGSHIKHYGRVLRNLSGIKVRTRNKTSVEDIDRELLKGNAVVIRYAARNNHHPDVMLDTFSKHIFLVAKRTDTSFYCVNVAGGHHWVKKERFASLFLSTDMEGYPKVWYARKSP